MLQKWLRHASFADFVKYVELSTTGIWLPVQIVADALADTGVLVILKLCVQSFK